jgi:opacity protein-like surface antigen
MRIRNVAVLICLTLATPALPAAAQRTGDRARLVFTVSGAYVSGQSLWAISDQEVRDGPLVDTFFIQRSIQSTFGASFSGTYFPGDKLGLTADASLIGLGFEDSCRLTAPAQSARSQQVCQSIDSRDRSAAAATLSAGAIVRIASREFISPFARATAGLLFSNESAILTNGTATTTQGPAEFVVYDDNKRTRVSPAFALGVGATFALAKAYHLRWEVRDNIVGVERVTGGTPQLNLVPPHERTYKHLFTVLIGIDVILERQRGRRY